MSKLIYTNPKIEVISVDSEISMILMSEYTPPDKPGPQKAATSGPTETSSSFEHNPFGTEE